MPHIHAAHLVSNIHARMDGLSRSSFKSPPSNQNKKISCESIFRLIDLNARAGNKQKHEAAMSVHVGDTKHGDVNAQTRRTNEMHISL